MATILLPGFRESIDGVGDHKKGLANNHDALGGLRELNCATQCIGHRKAGRSRYCCSWNSGSRNFGGWNSRRRHSGWRGLSCASGAKQQLLPIERWLVICFLMLFSWNELMFSSEF